MSKIGYFLGGALLGALGTAILAYIADSPQPATASGGSEALEDSSFDRDWSHAKNGSDAASSEEAEKVA